MILPPRVRTIRRVYTRWTRQIVSAVYADIPLFHLEIVD